MTQAEQGHYRWPEIGITRACLKLFTLADVPLMLHTVLEQCIIAGFAALMLSICGVQSTLTTDIQAKSTVCHISAASQLLYVARSIQCMIFHLPALTNMKLQEDIYCTAYVRTCTCVTWTAL